MEEIKPKVEQGVTKNMSKNYSVSFGIALAIFCVGVLSIFEAYRAGDFAALAFYVVGFVLLFTGILLAITTFLIFILLVKQNGNIFLRGKENKTENRGVKINFTTIALVFLITVPILLLLYFLLMVLYP